MGMGQSGPSWQRRDEQMSGRGGGGLLRGNMRQISHRELRVVVTGEVGGGGGG